MTEGANFYNACIQNQVQPGFIADKVQQAGYVIDCVGRAFEGAGNLLTQYGFSGGALSLIALSSGTLLERKELHAFLSIEPGKITSVAIDRLQETGSALGAGLGLAVIGKPVTYVGNWMQNRETLCKIGEGFASTSKNEL